MNPKKWLLVICVTRGEYKWPYKKWRQLSLKLGPARKSRCFNAVFSKEEGLFRWGAPARSGSSTTKVTHASPVCSKTLCGGVISALSISVVSQLSVSAMALRFLHILDLARLVWSSDLLKVLQTLHAKTYGNAILSVATLRGPAIQPRRRRCRLYRCIVGHAASFKALRMPLSTGCVCSMHEIFILINWIL